MPKRKSSIHPDLVYLEKCNLVKDGCMVPPRIRSKLIKTVEKMQMAIASRPNESSFKFKLENFEIGGKLGCGKFSTVFLVRETSVGFVCALKSVDKNLIFANEMETDLRREIIIHSKLSHKNIVKFYTLFDDPVNFYLLTEYLPGGNLNNFRISQEEGIIKPGLAAQYTHQLAEALSYLHSLKIVHRDVKPNNVLLNVYGGCKLSGFGLAVCCECPLTQEIKTSYYTAPEILEKKPYNAKVDVWSLGIVIYELVCGVVPFISDDVGFLIKKWQKGSIRFPKYVNKLAANLMLLLLKYNPNDRLNSCDIIEFPWVNS